MKNILSNNQILTTDAKETYLTAQASSGTGTLTVKDITGFSVKSILLIGELEDENSEIIATHSTTAPSGSTITLAANLAKTHDVFAKVRAIPYNQIEIYHSTTATGEKDLLATIDVQPDSIETKYSETTKTSGYYFTRLKDSVNSLYSDYSDPIPYAGYGENTVGFAINYALKRSKMNGFTDFVDYQFCIDEVNACLDFIAGKLKGWSDLLKIDQVVGQTERGALVLGDMPSDIWEDKGNKSILDLRIGTGAGLDYLIWSDFEKKLEGVHHARVRTEATAGDTTLEIDNSYDFDEAGAVNVYVSGTLQTLTYTGVTRSETEGVLTGIPASGTGAITATIPVDTDVWYGESEGKSAYYSVNSNSEMVIWPLADSTYRNKNAYMDYWTGATKINSDNDTLDIWRYDMVKYWLTWAIRSMKDNDGKRDFNDGDYLQFLTILNDKIRNEKTAHRKKRGIKVNSITY